MTALGSVNGLAVCGLGKLGACIAASFAATGMVDVVGFDIDKSKVLSILENKPPVKEYGLDILFAEPVVQRHLCATTSVAGAVRDSEVCMFVVPTPSLEDGMFDNSFLIAAVRSVAREVRKFRKEGYTFIINSTVVPKTCEQELVPMVREILGDLLFYVVYKPEFIAIGTVLHDLLFPDFILLGSDDPASFEKVKLLYSWLVMNGNYQCMSLTEAELCKISLNCAITMKISYANQVASLADRLGADAGKILKAIGNDNRIGGAALQPGLPYGGPCFPRDNRMFNAVARRLGVWAGLASATDVLNRGLIDGCAREIYRLYLHEGGPVGILGQAYKPGTSLTEEAPGVRWAHYLISRKVKILTHDPMAECNATMEEVLACPIIVVATLWPEFQTVPIPVKAKLVDPANWLGRNPRSNS